MKLNHENSNGHTVLQVIRFRSNLPELLQWYQAKHRSFRSSISRFCDFILFSKGEALTCWEQVVVVFLSISRLIKHPNGSFVDLAVIHLYARIQHPPT